MSLNSTPNQQQHPPQQQTSLQQWLSTSYPPNNGLSYGNYNAGSVRRQQHFESQVVAGNTYQQHGPVTFRHSQIRRIQTVHQQNVTQCVTFQHTGSQAVQQRVVSVNMTTQQQSPNLAHCPVQQTVGSRTTLQRNASRHPRRLYQNALIRPPAMQLSTSGQISSQTPFMGQTVQQYAPVRLTPQNGAISNQVHQQSATASGHPVRFSSSTPYAQNVIMQPMQGRQYISTVQQPENNSQAAAIHEIKDASTCTTNEMQIQCEHCGMHTSKILKIGRTLPRENKSDDSLSLPIPNESKSNKSCSPIKCNGSMQNVSRKTPPKKKKGRKVRLKEKSSNDKNQVFFEHKLLRAPVNNKSNSKINPVDENSCLSKQSIYSFDFSDLQPGSNVQSPGCGITKSAGEMDENVNTSDKNGIHDIFPPESHKESSDYFSNSDIEDESLGANFINSVCSSMRQSKCSPIINTEHSSKSKPSSEKQEFSVHKSECFKSLGDSNLRPEEDTFHPSTAGDACTRIATNRPLYSPISSCSSDSEDKSQLLDVPTEGMKIVSDSPKKTRVENHLSNAKDSNPTDIEKLETMEKKSDCSLANIPSKNTSLPIKLRFKSWTNQLRACQDSIPNNPSVTSGTGFCDKAPVTKAYGSLLCTFYPVGYRIEPREKHSNICAKNDANIHHDTEDNTSIDVITSTGNLHTSKETQLSEATMNPSVFEEKSILKSKENVDDFIEDKPADIILKKLAKAQCLDKLEPTLAKNQYITEEGHKTMKNHDLGDDSSCELSPQKSDSKRSEVSFDKTESQTPCFMHTSVDIAEIKQVEDSLPSNVEVIGSSENFVKEKQRLSMSNVSRNGDDSVASDLFDSFESDTIFETIHNFLHPEITSCHHNSSKCCGTLLSRTVTPDYCDEDVLKTLTDTEEDIFYKEAAARDTALEDELTEFDCSCLHSSDRNALGDRRSRQPSGEQPDQNAENITVDRQIKLENFDQGYEANNFADKQLRHQFDWVKEEIVDCQPPVTYTQYRHLVFDHQSPGSSCTDEDFCPPMLYDFDCVTDGRPPAGVLHIYDKGSYLVIDPDDEKYKCSVKVIDIFSTTDNYEILSHWRR